jgi:hypothetical protein
VRGVVSYRVVQAAMIPTSQPILKTLAAPISYIAHEDFPVRASNPRVRRCVATPRLCVRVERSPFRAIDTCLRAGSVGVYDTHPGGEPYLRGHAPHPQCEKRSAVLVSCLRSLFVVVVCRRDGPLSFCR